MSAVDAQQSNNEQLWARDDLVAEYDHRSLRPAEVLLLVRLRDELAGRVLELGCGAGRVTHYLAAIATELHAIDVNPAMVARTAQTVPRAHVELGDATSLDGHDAGAYDAVVAACNVLDALAPDARHAAILEARRVLREGGVFLLSGHNRAAIADIPSPTRLRPQDGVGRLVRDTLAMPRRVRNRHARRRFERDEPAYAVVTDVGHDYAVLHYYAFRADQERELRDAGFAVEAVLDLDGRELEPGDGAPRCHELHYIARAR